MIYTMRTQMHAEKAARPRLRRSAAAVAIPVEARALAPRCSEPSSKTPSKFATLPICRVFEPVSDAHRLSSHRRCMTKFRISIKKIYNLHAAAIHGDRGSKPSGYSRLVTFSHGSAGSESNSLYHCILEHQLPSSNKFELHVRADTAAAVLTHNWLRM